MKIIIPFIIILIAANIASGQAPNTWTQKADVGFNIPNTSELPPRFSAVGFSIGTKGYLGTGWNYITIYHDFWEYDPVTNVWTQKADFAGGDRAEAVGFCIGSKGYIGTGIDSITYYNDFWEYDPALNTWTQKADFAGGERSEAVGFRIGNNGYLGTGLKNYEHFNDFWQYNPVTNIWTKKADFAGGEINAATGFGIGNKGYLGTGFISGTGYTKDFWEYNPSANVWTKKANFGGGARSSAISFNIGSKGYIGTGFYTSFAGDIGYRDFWEYNQALDEWNQIADSDSTPGLSGKYNAAGFSIGNKWYVCTGVFSGDEVWEYDLITDQWTKKNESGNGYDAFGFSIGSKGYIGGVGNYPENDFWEYDPLLNAWSQKADCITFGIGFSIEMKGYLCTSGENNFWEYDPATNIWTQKTSFPDPYSDPNGRGTWGTAFSIGSKGYLFHGGDSYEFWEYNPSTDTWTSKADFEGLQRRYAVGFSIDGKGYIGPGEQWTNGSPADDFWEYNPTANAWTQKSDFGPATDAVGFSAAGKGYIQSFSPKSFWEYDPTTDVWTKRANFPGDIRKDAVGFNIGDKGYVGNGYEIIDGNEDNFQDKSLLPKTSRYENYQDFWEYTPYGLSCVATITPSGTISTCAGVQITLTANSGSGLTYKWFKNGVFIAGASNKTYKTSVAGSYRVQVTDIYGCSAVSNATTVNVNPRPLAIITPSDTARVCTGAITTLTANAGAGYTYQWIKGGVDISGATGRTYTTTTTDNGPFKVRVTTSFGCDSLSAPTIVKRLPTPVSEITVLNGGNQNLCAGEVKLRASGAVGSLWQWNKNINPVPVATTQIFIPASTGIYTVKVTNTQGCSARSDTVKVTSTCAQPFITKNDKQSLSAGNKTSFTLYPNPTTGDFVIDLKLNKEVNGEAVVQIYNTLGKMISVEKTPITNGVLFNEMKLNANLAAGIYLVRVIVNDEIYQRQLVYQK